MLDRSNSKPDFDAAKRHLGLLTGKQDPAVTWQVFDDTKKDPSLAACFHGRLDEVIPRLKAAQRKGCGVFVSVNETDGKGRRNENMRRARALFLDLDGTPLPDWNDWSINPDLTIRSSTVDGVEKFQCWWFIKPTNDWDTWRRAQKALALKFGGDPKCTLTTQVGRCAGFFHQKRRDQRSRVEIDLDLVTSNTRRHRLDYLIAELGLDLSTVDRPSERDQVDRPPPMYGWDNELDIAAAQMFVADQANWKTTSDGGVSVFNMACHIRDLGVSSIRAVELIREYLPVYPDSWPDDHVERKVAHAYRYAQNEAGAHSFEADRQNLAASLIDRDALSDFLGDGGDNE